MGDRPRYPSGEPDLDVLVFERRPEVVVALGARERLAHRRDAFGGSFGGVDDEPVPGLGVDLAQRLGPYGGEHPVGVLGLEGSCLPRDGDERGRGRAFEEGERLGLVLPGVDHERTCGVDHSRAELGVVDGLDLGEDADGEQPVDPRAGRRHHVVRCALLVALGVGEARVIELRREQPVGGLAVGTDRRTHSPTCPTAAVSLASPTPPASSVRARSTGSSSLGPNSVASRFAP